jgi:hypothetical protein
MPQDKNGRIMALPMAKMFSHGENRATCPLDHLQQLAIDS